MSERKVKFTGIDFLIILVVILVLVIGSIILLPKAINSSDTKKVDFVVMIQGKDENFANAISEGDNVTISLTEKDGGVVKSVETKPAEAIAYNSIDGTYSNEIIEGKSDVYITIEADANISDVAVKTGGTAIKVGSEIPVRGKGYASTGYVIDIND